ncbi:MAG: hypothetical protein K9L98_00420 [Candidatus Pacebacteria bacterium]|nr:hypothetical protein [Candidatus Paceibacterota bacterium]MCF7862462.1 hypothetical protein [Candidatus Paceibacterota bacterium]
MKTNCQNCKKDFDITKNDLGFYEKIKVPSPTFCPECRMIRRMAWRNERHLHKNKCDICKENIISIYSEDSPYKVLCGSCFHGDAWNPFDYEMEIDFSKPFLQQVKELQLKVPRLYSFVFQNTNSEYTNGAAFNKNCYLIFVSDYDEDCAYCYSTTNSKNSLDLFNSTENELCYDSSSCVKCFAVSFSEDCASSQNLIFCKNCNNCSDCIGCVNLRNKKHCLFNEQLTEEEYKQKKKELNLENRESLKSLEKQAREVWSKYPLKYIHGLKNIDVMGDYTNNSKNSSFVFDSNSVEDSKFLNFGSKIKDSQDAYVLVDGSELCNEIVSGITLSNAKCSYCVWVGFNISYSDTCENSNNLFGCVGVRKGEYCILNKKYSKEEYEQLVEKIIKHMNDMPYVDEKGIVYKYGEFFPIDLSPFSYNETIAQEYFPLEEKEALEKGYRWMKKKERDYKIEIKSEEIPQEIEGVGEDIVNKVIECAHKGDCNHQCTEAFRIRKSDFDFYKRLKLPLPDLCPNCRHTKRFKTHNPLQFWERGCMNKGCQNKFKTTYSPDRPEVVYCESCYQKEVY